MRRIAAVIAIAAAASAASCGDDGSPATTAAPTTTSGPATTMPTASTGPAASTTYSNTEWGFRLSYPSSWTVEEGLFGSVVVFLSPLLSDDAFSENVNLVVEDLRGEDLTLDEYLDISLGTLESVITDFDLIGEAPDELGGVAARTIRYRGTSSGTDLLWRQTIIVHDGSAWVLTYTGERDFDHFTGEADTIFHSWEFLG